MAVKVTAVLRCDRGNCTAVVRSGTHNSATLRAGASKVGWTVTGPTERGKSRLTDHCPRCTDILRELSALEKTG